jgi:hypothetical protein
VTLTAGGAVNGSVTVNDAISSGSGTITLTADDIDINAPLSSTGALTLQPVTASQSIGIAGGAGAFSLSSSDLANVTDGFSSITIGRSNGSGVITINAVTFNDPVTIQAPSGPIIVAGPITGTGNASIFLNSSDSVGQQITLNAGITTAGQLISLDNVVLGADVTLDTTNAGASPAGANITFRTTTIDADSAANSRALTLTAGTAGAVTLPSAVGGTEALGSLTVSSSSVTVAAVTTSGNIGLTTGAPLTVAGPIASGTGAIDLVGSRIVQNANVSTGGTGNVTATATVGSITMADGTVTTAAGTGAVSYQAPGPITLGLLTAPSGAVTVNSTGGSILDGNTAALNILAGTGATLTAGSVIGTLVAPIDVQVTNLANVNATGQIGGVSININGTTGDNTLHFPLTVPGQIYFNSVLLYSLSPPPVSFLGGSGLEAVLSPFQQVLSACEPGAVPGGDGILRLRGFCRDGGGSWSLAPAESFSP